MSKRTSREFFEAVLKLNDCSETEHFGKDYLQVLRKLLYYDNGACLDVALNSAEIVPKDWLDIDESTFTAYQKYYWKYDPAINVYNTRECFVSGAVSSINNYYNKFIKPGKPELERSITILQEELFFPNGMKHILAIDFHMQSVERKYTAFRINRGPNKDSFTKDEIELIGEFNRLARIIYESKRISEYLGGIPEYFNKVNQGICIFAIPLQCVYINDQAKRLFLSEGSWLYKEIKEICHNFRIQANVHKGLSECSNKVYVYEKTLVNCTLLTFYSHGRCFIQVSFDCGWVNGPWQRGNIFSPQERKILCLLSENKNNIKIKEELDISVNTLNTHLRNIKQKTKTNTRSELSQQAKQLLLQDTSFFNSLLCRRDDF